MDKDKTATAYRSHDTDNNVPTVEMAAIYRRPGYLIRRAHQLNMALFSRHCESATNTQFGVLWVLSCKGEVDQATLTRLLQLDRTNAGTVVRVLVKKGWVRRVRSTNDRRQWRISMTDLGRDAFERLLWTSEEAQRHMLAPLGADEQAVLIRLLGKLVFER